MNKTAESLRNIRKLRQEIAGLEAMIQRSRRTKVTDVVSGSSAEFPYAERHFTVSGADVEKTNSLYRRLQKKKKRLECEISGAEELLDTATDPEVRNILRLRYENGLSWNDVARVCDSTEDAVRKKAERFLKKL